MDGTTSKFTSPLIVTAVGFLGGQMVKESLLKDVAMGVTIAGGASLVNSAMNKDIVTLSGDEDTSNTPIILPGVGTVEDERIYYDELPTNNEQMTSYNSDLQPIGEVEYEEVYEDVVSGVDDEQILA